MRPARVCFSGFLSLTGYRFYHFLSYQGIGFINFCLKQGIVSWTINSLRICSTNYTTAKFLPDPRDSVDQAVNSFVIANGLNKKEFRYLLSFIIVLHMVSKIGNLS